MTRLFHYVLLKIMRDLKQQGIIQPNTLIILTAVGILLFLVFASVAPFNNGLFSQLYQKPSSEAKGPPNKGGYGSCYVKPNPNTVGGQYTVYGSNLKPNELIYVWVQDSHGTLVLFPPVDASGNFTITSYSSWSGTSTVNIYDNTNYRKPVFLTSCTFQVN